MADEFELCLIGAGNMGGAMLAGAWMGRASLTKALPPIALAMTKRLLNNSLEVTMEEALDDEGMAQTVNFGTQDTMEAMTAFVEKRSPNFRGR